MGFFYQSFVYTICLIQIKIFNLFEGFCTGNRKFAHGTTVSRIQFF